MDKGWGLTLDSDPVSFFSSKQANFSSNNHHKRGIMFPGIEFPVSLSRREGLAASAPAVSDEDRTVVSEVDFFSDKNKGKDKEFKGVINVKKENSHEEGPRIDLDVNTGLRLRTTNTGSDQSMVDDGVSSDAEDKRAKNELAVLQAELERMNSENQRLTAMLSQVSNNYNALQMHLVALMQQQQQQQQNSNAKIIHEKEIAEAKFEDKKQQGGVQVVPRQFMELGPSCATETEEQCQSSSEERTHSGSLINHNNKKEIVQFDQEKNKGIQRDDSPESESWAPNKVPKLSEPKPVDHATEATMRKARVSVRARSEAPMITDGCQWRKYGQKMAKGNPCPRAYYRCTMALGCPVRKQVQRCAEDKAILITTYEGTHNHPLPPAAVAMASTTSAAANMLLSGSMPSGDGLMNPNFLARAILPCSSSVATISASAPFPTVTLDLTHNTNPLQFQRPPPQFNMPFHGQAPNFTNVAAPPQAAHVFGQALYNQSKFSGLQLSQDMDQSAQLGQQMQNPSFADTLSAATAAITADPNFTAALAAAISSIIGGGHPNSSNNNNTTSTTATTHTSCSNGNKIGGFPGN